MVERIILFWNANHMGQFKIEEQKKTLVWIKKACLWFYDKLNKQCVYYYFYLNNYSLIQFYNRLNSNEKQNYYLYLELKSLPK